jgi:hypothetical protein
LGDIDRLLRIVAGVFFIIIGVLNKSWWAVVVGLFMILTGLISWCPLYALLRINTFKS